MHPQITIHESPLGRFIELFNGTTGDFIEFHVDAARILAVELAKEIENMDKADKLNALKDIDKSNTEKKGHY